MMTLTLHPLEVQGHVLPYLTALNCHYLDFGGKECTRTSIRIKEPLNNVCVLFGGTSEL